jgi:hypothetical protein
MANAKYRLAMALEVVMGLCCEAQATGMGATC